MSQPAGFRNSTRWSSDATPMKSALFSTTRASRLRSRSLARFAVMSRTTSSTWPLEFPSCRIGRTETSHQRSEPSPIRAGAAKFVS